MAPSGRQEIAWREWGRGAMREAERRRKPILLDVGATWCHWCHVMESETYSDPDVVTLVNGLYIPIKVDIDRRPDIAERYHFGGYPSTVFLTPGGEILLGATYLKPDDLKTMLVEVAEIYEEQQDHHYFKDVHRMTVKTKPPFRFSVALTDKIYEKALGAVVEAFDPENGGFGTGSKFPEIDPVLLTLFHFRETGDESVGEVLKKSLAGYAQLQDPVEGGFYRYSVTPDWSEPHYEKLLEVNAELARLFLLAGHVLGDEGLSGLALGTLAYLDRVLWEEEMGAYRGSQAADEDYYRLDASARRARKAPSVDPVVLPGANAEAGRALLLAWALTGEERYRERARRIAELMIGEGWSRARGTAHSIEGGKAAFLGLLTDQVAAGEFLLHLATCGEPRLVAKAAAPGAVITAKHWAQGRALRDRPDEDRALGLLSQVLVEPTACARASAYLLLLSEATGDPSFKETAEDVLGYFADEFEEQGPLAAAYALAALKLFDPAPIAVHLAGEEGARAGGELVAAYDPRKLVFPAPPRSVRAKALGLTAPGVYVCAEDACSPPLPDAEAAEGFLAGAGSAGL